MDEKRISFYENEERMIYVSYYELFHLRPPHTFLILKLIRPVSSKEQFI